MTSEIYLGIKLFDIFGQDKAIHIDMVDFSSGEKAKLNLYSKLYSYRKTKDIKGNVLLIIDECGLYYHPEWQQAFLYDIIKYLNELFIDGNVQIMIATHSPILLSDVAKGNIVFLRRSESNGFRKIDMDFQNTFAANINNLLADSFFLKDGVMGKFSYEKVSNDLNSLEDLSQDDKYKLLKKYYQVIGDEIIRFQIKQALGGNID